MKNPFTVRRVAVLGAGVMGAQIAALCVNAGIETRLYDLSGEGSSANGLVEKAIKGLKQQMPTPLATSFVADQIRIRNYDEHLSELSDCDLIIEAIGEKLAWKADLYQKISPYLTESTTLVSNTSGLSVNALAMALPKAHRARFCGVHFFNPPRYMHLAELIPTEYTAVGLMDHLETWLTRRLGKGVVRAKDTPNFIANRIGVFSLLATIHHAERLGLGLDEVDALTGSLLGRPKSATFRTLDVVGLDTMKHVVDTMQMELKDDPWHALFYLPEWMVELIQQGHLGQKSGAGLYRKKGTQIEVFDPRLKDYRLAKTEVDPVVKELLQSRDPVLRMQRLLSSTALHAQFLSACFLDLFRYCAFHLGAIAHTVRDVDEALRWGFGWQEGPFETWQAANIERITQAMMSDTSSIQVELPAWLPGLEAFYNDQGAFSCEKKSYEGVRQLPVYQRQLSIHGRNVLFENEGVRLTSLGDDIAVLSFKSKSNTIGQSVLDGLQEALNIAEASSQGMIIHQADATNFSSGADLRAVSQFIKSKEMAALASMLETFQQVALRLKYSVIPVIAGVRGRALGGGCELMMHCAGIVAAFESYPGLVEAGVGLIPAGGGCKEWAMRTAQKANNASEMNRLIRVCFEQTALAVVASSAPDAQARGFLKRADHWVMHHNEVLFAGCALIKAMQAMNYAPPLKTLFKVAGREGHAGLQASLINGLEGGFISPHDYYLANQLAAVLCGGDVTQGTLVDEAWMLRLEREAFLRLAESSLSQARINHLLETGKPLRN
jgi:3-hydroxyacyl-CoA dehydrogenase